MDSYDPDYEKILDKRSLVYLGDEKLIEYIVNWTDKKRTVYEHNRTTIKNSLDEEDVAGFDDWSFLNGHDFTLLLLLVLNKKIRLKNPHITLEQFEDSLILSMGKEYLSTTSIYQSLANWSDANGISILK